MPKVLMVLMVLGASMAQTPPLVARNGIITGQVVDATTGKPVSAAVVTLGGPGLPARVTPTGLPGGQVNIPRILTGSDGRFMFNGLAAGRFTVTASKGGYAEGASGRRRPGGATQAIVLTDAQPAAADVVVRVWKNGAMSGTVTDEAGEPVVALQVRALGRTIVGGKRRFVPRGAAAVTDDRGAYRFSNLPAGDYIVVASPPSVSARVSAADDMRRSGRASGELATLLSLGALGSIRVGETLIAAGRGAATPPPPVDGRLMLYPPTFHPSTLAPAQAGTIALAAGEERTGIDVQLQPVPTARVSGTVTSSTGPAPATLRLFPAGMQEVDAAGFAAVSAADAGGVFTFPAVAPGQYSLRAVERDASGLSWIDMPITVAGTDVDGVVAVLRPALRITARLEFEGSAPPPTQRPGQFVALPFTLESDDNVPLPPPTGSTAADQGLTIGGFPAGKYRVRVQNSPAGWMFKAAMLNGVDVSETPFEFSRDVSGLVIAFTDRWSGIGGSVQGAGADGATVAVFPTDAQAWTNYGPNPRRLRSTSANAKGEFGLSSVPPGDYYVVAFAEEQSTDWRDPKMLEALARLATQVTILEGEHKMIDLRMREVRQ